MNVSLMEARKAISAYNWLRISPLITIFTLLFVVSMGIGNALCNNLIIDENCYYGLRAALNLIIGVLVSALWHLNLLQYANDKDSEFVQAHGRKALSMAGIRTGVAFVGVVLYSFVQVDSLILLTIVVLIILWIGNASTGAKLTDELKPVLQAGAATVYAPSVPVNQTQSTGREFVMESNMKTLERILADIQSTDHVTVFAAFQKLKELDEITDPLMRQAILKELELLGKDDDNQDIRQDAQMLFDRLNRITAESAPQRKSGAVFTGEPAEVLARSLEALLSEKTETIYEAFDTLAGINYSSEVIRHRLEKLAVQSQSPEIRREALNLLNSAANRAVQRRFIANKLDRGIRFTLLQEINEWEKGNLLDKQNADVIRRRYDFDIAPQTPPKPFEAAQGKPVQAKTAIPTTQAVQPKPAPVETPPPAAPTKPSVPPEPRPTLLQTLTSEASIKIYLYLGAFFVIAAAAILGAVVPELRLPILIVGTLIFGGLAVLIKKRLPQPSFALFIVFSFLLPITANSLAESLKQSFDLTSTFISGYWAVVFFVMAVVWIGSTWLYESRLFSLTAFGSLTLSFLNIGNAIEAEMPIYTALMGATALAGLGGTFRLKKWRDGKFALPLFLASQLLQVIILGYSLTYFGIDLLNSSSGEKIHLFTFITWALGAAYYLTADRLYPFIAFPWLAAATLIPMPWFISFAFELESLGFAILLFGWCASLAIVSEPLFRNERAKKYGLPILLVSIPNLALAVFAGFVYETWLGLVIAFGFAILQTALHSLRTRWWLWTLALFNAIVAYFAFFELEFIQNLNVFFGYELVGIAILFLLPDLILKKDWKENLQWRLPPRIFGVLFLTATSLILFNQDESGHIAAGYLALALFSAAYAIAYRNSYLGYLPAAYLPIALIFALDAFDIDAWLPALSALSILYYGIGVALRKEDKWATMLRNSGMILGVFLSFTALLQGRQTGGWYTLLMGTLFIAEMHVRKSGWFEIGAPILFTSGAFLILNDFHVDKLHYHMLAYSLVWVFTDLINHLTFPHLRPTKMVMRGMGALLAAFNLLFVFTEAPSLDAAICFGMYTLASAACTLVYRKAWLGYIPAGSFALTIYFTLDHFNLDLWLPILTALFVLYFIVGLYFRSNKDWTIMLRNSALILGAAISLHAFILQKQTGGWYALVAGLLFIAEMYYRRDGRFEVGAPILFTIGAFLILNDFDVERIPYHLLAYSLVWILADLLAHLTFTNPRPLSILVRGIGGLLAFANYGFLFLEMDARIGAIGFAIYSLLFLTISLLYRQPNLLYAFTVTLPLFVTFLFRVFNVTQWIHPVVVVAALYYAAGYFLRSRKDDKGWDEPLLYSGLSLGVIVSIGAPILGGLDASIPVAVAATLWAVEAFARRNAWLAFPANGLYLLAYFIILFEINVDEPQYFSIGTALFGLIQHYLLTRAQSKTGTFIMGMFSQFVLLGTTYIEMVDKNQLVYFFLLFAQSLVVLVYGLVIRSRSLTLFPIGFVALGVITVVYSALKDIGTIFLIGCTGIVLLALGVVAVLLRERISKLGEKLSDWKA